LADFLASLQLIEELTVDTVLPGHRRIFHDCRGRIKELKEHHRRRAEEALVILADGPMSGYQVAARMTWDMVFRSWEEVAPTQKYFATGEALSHIHFWRSRGGLDELSRKRVFCIIGNSRFYARVLLSQNESFASVRFVG